MRLDVGETVFKGYWKGKARKGEAKLGPVWEVPWRRIIVVLLLLVLDF